MIPPLLHPSFPGRRMNPSMGLGGDIPVADAPGKGRMQERLTSVHSLGLSHE